MPRYLAEQFPLPGVTADRPRLTTSDAPAHHKYGMSTLNYLAACPGFTQRQNDDNEAAEDGTRLHEIMQKVIARILNPVIDPKNGDDIADWGKTMTASKALKWVVQRETVTEDEETYLEFCCKELDRWLPKVDWHVTNPVRVEQRVYIHHPDGSELNYGHYDVLLFLSEDTAIKFDWKFGWIPVPSAENNWQGKGYAVGCFQEFPRLKKIGVVFVQPKLHRVTRTHYERSALYEMYREIKQVIEAAQAPRKRLGPGPYCDFCAVSSTCSALLNEAEKALAVYEGLPIPSGFAGLQINTAEDAAKAMYVLDRLQTLIDNAGHLKELAKQFARDNNGAIAAPLPDGKLITVELRQKNASRSARLPALIADTLKETLSPEQVLGCCDPKITALEEIFADAFVEKQSALSKSILDEAGGEAQRLEHSGDTKGAAQVRKRAKADAKAIRVTRKRAKEILNDTLLAEGLITRPDSKVEYLKMRIEKPVNTTQIQNG